MIVRETIHHGSYRNVRVIELPDMRRAALVRMVADCPYATSERVADRLGMALASGGSYSHGWVDWEVVK
jgi:spore coat polysaccharide biosynthesis protein SpsF (cytidylyltransferase family)